jgi:N-acetylglutamate synthase-like GNAT family acetyltransferase
MRTYTLRSNSVYLTDYVLLRNKYIKELCTKPVEISETKIWLTKTDSKVLIAIENKTVLGAIIVHPQRNGEITIFTKDKGSGVGSFLLKKGEKLAKNEGFNEVWVWALSENSAAHHFFIKNGYTQLGKVRKKDKIIGVRFIKEIK